MEEWYEKIKGLVLIIYTSPKRFISAYAMGKKTVFYRVISHLKIVPINLKHILEKLYKEFTTIKPDDY